MESEIWKDVAGYEGLYQVSSVGRVKRFYKNGKERILKLYPNGSNYLIVVLCKNSIHKQFRVHRLVATAFIPNPQNLPQVNHKDETKTNNHVENLEWCDAKYNNNYGTHIERSAEKQRKKVGQFTLAGEFVRTWPSLSQIGRDLGIGNVSPCCKGKRPSAGGFVWRFSLQ